jgi:hypothetical protein
MLGHSAQDHHVLWSGHDLVVARDHRQRGQWRRGAVGHQLQAVPAEVADADSLALDFVALVLHRHRALEVFAAAVRTEHLAAVSAMVSPPLCGELAFAACAFRGVLVGRPLVLALRRGLLLPGREKLFTHISLRFGSPK